MSVVLWNFYAEWSTEYQKMKSTIEKLEQKEYEVRNIDVEDDGNLDIINAYPVESLPSLIIESNKDDLGITDTFYGVTEFEEIEEALQTAEQ